jgi:hypothetical protein
MRKLLAVMAALLVMPVPALAGSVTLTGPTSITVPEDGAVHEFTYTFSNNSGASITAEGLLGPGGFHLSGDESDIPDFGRFVWGASGSTCNSLPFMALLADGFSCTVILRFNSLDGLGETDANFGTVTVSGTEIGSQFGAFIYRVSGADNDSFAFSPLTTIITTDLGFTSAVPEPSSLLLLALGALGLGWRQRQNRVR